MNNINTLFLTFILIAALIAQFDSKKTQKLRGIRDDIQSLRNDLKGLKQLKSDAKKPNAFKKEFDQADTTSSGLTQQQVGDLLTEIAKTYDIKAPKANDVTAFFNAADKKKNGKINYQEFIDELKESVEEDYNQVYEKVLKLVARG